MPKRDSFVCWLARKTGWHRLHPRFSFLVEDGCMRVMCVRCEWKSNGVSPATFAEITSGPGGHAERRVTRPTLDATVQR